MIRINVNHYDVTEELAIKNAKEIFDQTGEQVKIFDVVLKDIIAEIDENGNPTTDQMLGIGSLVKNDKVYTVKAVDVKSNSAMLNITGRDVWVFSGNLYEVSN